MKLRGRGGGTQVLQRKRSATELEEEAQEELDEDANPSEVDSVSYIYDRMPGPPHDPKKTCKWIIRCRRDIKLRDGLTPLDIVWKKAKRARRLRLLPGCVAAKVSTAVRTGRDKDSEKSRTEGVVIVYLADYNDRRKALDLALALERMGLRGLVVSHKRNPARPRSDAFEFKTDEATSAEADKGYHMKTLYKYHALCSPEPVRSLLAAGERVADDVVLLTDTLRPFYPGFEEPSPPVAPKAKGGGGGGKRRKKSVGPPDGSSGSPQKSPSEGARGGEAGGSGSDRQDLSAEAKRRACAQAALARFVAQPPLPPQDSGQPGPSSRAPGAGGAAPVEREWVCLEDTDEEEEEEEDGASQDYDDDDPTGLLPGFSGRPWAGDDGEGDGAAGGRGRDASGPSTEAPEAGPSYTAAAASPDSVGAPVGPGPASAPTQGAPGPSAGPFAPPGVWSCPTCTLDNDPRTVTCSLCGAQRPSAARPQQTAAAADVAEPQATAARDNPPASAAAKPRAPAAATAAKPPAAKEVVVLDDSDDDEGPGPTPLLPPSTATAGAGAKRARAGAEAGAKTAPAAAAAAAAAGGAGAGAAPRWPTVQLDLDDEALPAPASLPTAATVASSRRPAAAAPGKPGAAAMPPPAGAMGAAALPAAAAAALSGGGLAAALNTWQHVTTGIAPAPGVGAAAPVSGAAAAAAVCIAAAEAAEARFAGSDTSAAPAAGLGTVGSGLGGNAGCPPAAAAAAGPSGSAAHGTLSEGSQGVGAAALATLAAQAEYGTAASTSLGLGAATAPGTSAAAAAPGVPPGRSLAQRAAALGIRR